MAAVAGEIPFQSELVGRTAELERFGGYIAAAARGRGRVVFVAGEAGIGKSRLLEEVRARAARAGFRTMAGTCFHESLTPYSAFLEAFQEGGLDYLFQEEPIRVESLFVIDQAGLVLAKAERAESPLDPDIFTSMIRVVEEFLKDAVRQAGGSATGGLNVLGLADYRIILQPGPHATVVAILKGRENEFLIEDLRDLVGRVEDKYGAVLAQWTGTLEELAGMDEILKPVLASKKYDGVDYARSDAQIRRNRLFENISLGLVREARQTPTLLTLDDLQWADPSSIALIHYIARGVRDSHFLLLGAYRSEELAMGLRAGQKHPLEEAIQLMSREGLHEELRITRLDEGETTQLVESILGRVDLAEEWEREVFRHSGGNPFFLIELARLVVQEGLLVREGEVWRFSKTFRQVEIPTRVYHVIQRRLQRVTGEMRDVLDFAAILGDEFGTDALATCLGRDRISLLRLLRDLEGTHQLVRSLQAKYRFDHPQVREVLLREMPEGIRMEYHRIAGESLEKMHGANLTKNRRALAEVAFHFFEARDAERAIPYSLQAAAAAKAVYANEEAIQFFSHALELMGDGTPAEERALALEGRGDLRDLAGHYEGAVEDYRQALSLSEGDREHTARLRRKVGSVFQRRGAYDDAERELRVALELHGEAADAELGRVDLALGQTASRRGDYEAAMQHFLRAHEVLTAARDRDDAALAEAQYSAGMVHYWLAMREPAREPEELQAARKDFLACVETRKRIADELGMRPALNMLATTYAQAQDYPPAIDYYGQSIKIGERVGDLPGVTKPIVNLGRVYAVGGQEDLALEMYLRALRILVKIGDQHTLARVYWFAAEIYAGRGDWDAAENYYTRCRDIADRIGDKVSRAGGHRGLGDVRLARGQLADATAELTAALDAFEAVGEWEHACLSAADLVRVHILLGEFDAARSVCTRGRAVAARGETARLEGLCAAMEASLARALGKNAEAAKHLDAAASAFGDIPVPKDVAALEYERGLLAKADGHGPQADAHLGRAAEAARHAGLFGLAVLAENARHG